jgi:glucan phosphoethanolaminetransferase (alkaline phosphatase superfamily)
MRQAVPPRLNSNCGLLRTELSLIGTEDSSRPHPQIRPATKNRSMDWFFLAFSIFFTGYSFYAWKTYSDDESFWFALLYAFVVLLLFTKLFLLNLFPENIKTVINILVYCSWALMLLGLSWVLWQRKK